MLKIKTIRKYVWNYYYHAGICAGLTDDVDSEDQDSDDVVELDLITSYSSKPKIVPIQLPSKVKVEEEKSRSHPNNKSSLEARFEQTESSQSRRFRSFSVSYVQCSMLMHSCSIF